MTDSMKFGPEWLRNMSNDIGNSTSSGVGAAGGGNVYHSSNSNSIDNISPSNQPSSAPRYQLAEFRYGREEMLSLYDKNIKTPELLPKYKKLYIEKVQCPLALLPPSSEEDVVSTCRHEAFRLMKFCRTTAFYPKKKK